MDYVRELFTIIKLVDMLYCNSSFILTFFLSFDFNEFSRILDDESEITFDPGDLITHIDQCVRIFAYEALLL